MTMNNTGPSRTARHRFQDGPRNRFYDRRQHSKHFHRRFHENDTRNNEASDRDFAPGYSFVTKVKREIIQFCDPKKDINVTGDIAQLSQLLAQPAANQEDIANVIAGLLIDSIHELPLKIPYTAGLICAAHQQKCKIIPVMLNLLIRFLACVNPILHSNLAVGLLQALLDWATKNQSSLESVQLAELIYCILLSIPYIMIGSVHDKDEFETVFKQMKTIMEEVSKMSSLLSQKPHFDVLIKSNSHNDESCETYLTALYFSLNNYFGESFTPNSCFEKLDRSWSDYVQGKDIEKITLSLPEVEWSELSFPMDLSLRYNALQKPFRLFNEEKLETTPKTNNVYFSLLYSNIVETLDVLEFNRKIAAQNLIDLDIFYSYGTFTLRGIPLGELEQKVSDGSAISTWKLEDMITETVFAKLLSLPKSSNLPAYYFSVITESCSLAPKIMAQTIGRAIRIFFKNCHLLEPELLFRFIQWFAHHLNNFSYQWKWTEWIEIAKELPENHPQIVLIASVIDLECRMGDLSKVKVTLPEEFQKFLRVSEMSDEPVDPNSLKNFLLEEPSPQEFEEYIKSCEPEKQKLEHVVKSILDCGSKVVYASLSLFKKLIPVLSAFKEKTDNPDILIDIVYDYYATDFSKASIVLSGLIDLGLIEGYQLINWLCQSDRVSLLQKVSTYTLIDKALKTYLNSQKNDSQMEMDGPKTNSLKPIIEHLMANVLSKLDEVQTEDEWQLHWIGGFQRYIIRACWSYCHKFSEEGLNTNSKEYLFILNQ